MSNIQGVINHLEDVGLITAEIEAALRNYMVNKSLSVLPFGKYRGKKISEIAEFDSKYLEWVVKQSWLDDKLKKEINGVLTI